MDADGWIVLMSVIGLTAFGSGAVASVRIIQAVRISTAARLLLLVSCPLAFYLAHAVLQLMHDNIQNGWPARLLITAFYTLGSFALGWIGAVAVYGTWRSLSSFKSASKGLR